MPQKQSESQFCFSSLFIVPHRTSFGVVGGGSNPPLGTFADYVIVERNQVIRSPDHLDDIQVSAWPLAGLTAWRFVFVAMMYPSYP